MRLLLRLCCVMLLFVVAYATSYGQTTTTASGDWQTAGNWSAGVPGATTNAATVNHAMTLSAIPTNVTTGVYNINADVTDPAGGTAYGWTFSNGAYNAAQCVLNVTAGTTTIEGTLTLGNANLYVRNGATLIVGSISSSTGTRITIEATGTLIVNGNWTDGTASSGSTTIGNSVINGYVRVNGNYTNTSINATAKISGSGQMYVTGTISTAGSATVFGTTNNANVANTSGRALLCGVSGNAYSTAISPLSQNVCSDVAAGTITHAVGGGVTVASRQWQVSSQGPGWGYSDISGATSATYTPPATSGNRWYRVYYSISGCATQYLSLNMYSQPAEVIDPTITPNAGFDVSITSPVTSTVLAANTPPTGNVGTWSVVSGPHLGTSQFSNINNPTAIFSPSCDGTYTLRWSMSCASLTDDVVITVTGNNSTWVGGTSADWNTASNWSPAYVPNTLSEVTIPSGTTFSPILPTGDVYVGGLTINSGATVTQSANFGLTISCGGMVNNGTFVEGWAVDFRAGTQSLTGSTTSIVFNRLRVIDCNLTLEVNALLNKEVWLQGTSTFDPDGASNNKIFTLQSTDDSPDVTARIAAIPSGSSITGKVRFKRYMDAYEYPSYQSFTWGGYTYNPQSGSLPSLISIPVQNATVADIQGEIKIGGTFTTPSSFPNCPTCVSYMTLRTYNEPDTTNTFAGAWKQFPVSSNTEVFPTNQGIYLWRFGHAYGDNDVTWALDGIPVQGDVTVPVTYTYSYDPDWESDGFMIFPNPYCSTIDLSSGGITNLNVATTGIFTTPHYTTAPDYWNPNRSVWNNNTMLGTDGGTPYIVAGQSVYAQADWGDPEVNISTSVTITEAAKTSYTASDVVFTSINNQLMFAPPPSTTSHFKIKLVDGGYNVETIIGFFQGATSGIDRRYDAYSKTAPNVTESKFSCNSFKNGVYYNHNILSLDSIRNSNVDLLVYSVANSGYTLEWSKANIPSDVRVLLHDKELDVYTDMMAEDSYTYTATTNNAAGRFKVIFGPIPPTYPVILGSSKGINGSNTTTHTVTYPSGIQSGELLVLMMALDGNTTITKANGFVRGGSYTYQSTPSMVTFWKYADGTESGNISFTSSASEQSSWMMMRFSSGAVMTSTGGYGTGGDVADTYFPSTGTTNINDYAILFGVRYGDGTTQPSSSSSGFTIYDSQIGGSGNAALWVEYKNLVATGNQAIGVATTAIDEYMTNSFMITYPRKNTFNDIGNFSDYDMGRALPGSLNMNKGGVYFKGNGKKITKIRMQMAAISSLTVTAEIYSSTGTAPNALPNTSLASGSIAGISGTTSDYGWAEITLSTPLQTTANQDYFLVISSTGGNYSVYGNNKSDMPDNNSNVVWSGSSWSTNSGTRVLGPFVLIYKD